MSRAVPYLRRVPRFALIGLLLIALGLRVGFSLSREASDAAIASLPDQREYLDLGRSLLAGNGLAMVDARFADVVRAFRMPGYPSFVAACAGRVTAIRLAQAVVDTSTVLAVFWLGRRWLSAGASLFAAAIVAFDPIHIYFSSLILSETLFASMLAWGTACVVHGRSPISLAARNARMIWWGGIVLLIASIYVRPSALAFPVLIAAVAAFAEARLETFVPARRRWPVITIVAALTFAALLPWAARNRLVVDRWLFTTTNDGFTLYDGFNRSADGSSDQANLASLPLLANLNETQRSDYLKTLALRDAKSNPVRIVKLAPTKIARTWSPWPLSAQFGSRTLYVLIAACHAIPLFALAIVGFARASLPRSAKALLLAPAIFITLMQAVTVGSLRYRMPADASIAILAAAAVAPSPRRHPKTE